MKLALVCLLHPRDHIARMEEIDAIAKRLGWDEIDTYGIVVDHVGYTVGCGWFADKPSVESAREELAKHGVAATECEVIPQEEFVAARAKRQAEGYYDDMDIHA